MGVRRSTGTVGDAYDNAMAESFFATLGCELIDRRRRQTKTGARLALFTSIEGWYNGPVSTARSAGPSPAVQGLYGSEDSAGPVTHGASA